MRTPQPQSILHLSINREMTCRAFTPFKALINGLILLFLKENNPYVNSSFKASTLKLGYSHSL